MCGARKIVNPLSGGLSRAAMNDTEKQARLAQALRENLRRRKAQARAVDAEPAAAEADPKDEPTQQR
jgi:hypothetical protein